MQLLPVHASCSRVATCPAAGCAMSGACTLMCRCGCSPRRCWSRYPSCASLLLSSAWVSLAQGSAQRLSVIARAEHDWTPFPTCTALPALAGSQPPPARARPCCSAGLALSLAPHVPFLAWMAWLASRRRAFYVQHREVLCVTNVVLVNIMVRFAGAGVRARRSLACRPADREASLQLWQVGLAFHAAHDPLNAAHAPPAAGQGGTNYFYQHKGSPARLAGLLLMTGHAVWSLFFPLYHRLPLGWSAAAASLSAFVPVRHTPLALCAPPSAASVPAGSSPEQMFGAACPCAVPGSISPCSKPKVNPTCAPASQPARAFPPPGPCQAETPQRCHSRSAPPPPLRACSSRLAGASATGWWWCPACTRRWPTSTLCCLWRTTSWRRPAAWRWRPARAARCSSAWRWMPTS